MKYSVGDIIEINWSTGVELATVVEPDPELADMTEWIWVKMGSEKYPSGILPEKIIRKLFDANP